MISPCLRRTPRLRFGDGIHLDGPEGAENRVRRMLDLNTDARPILDALRRDPFLKTVLDGVTDLRLPGSWDPFEIAIRAIVGQQISVAAARTFLGRIVARFGDFPDAARLAESDLRHRGRCVAHSSRPAGGTYVAGLDRRPAEDGTAQVEPAHPRRS